MVAQSDLKFIGAQLLRREYANAVNKIQFYSDKISILTDEGNRSEAKRYQAPLKLFEKHKSNIEAEATRRNMPLDELIR